MIQLWKETLLPGTQRDARSQRAFTITKRDIRAGERNINRMVAKGRRIPLIYEHLDVEECDPEEWKANYARNTFGWVGGARLSTAEDVAAGIASRPGTLLIRHDIHDEKDAQQVRRTGFVSPKIYFDGYTDSQGEQYDGLAVSHVASSPTVCQFWQAPFQLSDADAFYLSYLPPDESDSGNSSARPIDTPENKSNSHVPFSGSNSPAEKWTFAAWLASARRAAGLTDSAPLDLSATEPPEGAVADDSDKGGKKEPEGGGNADLKAVVGAIKKAFPGAVISDKVTNWSELVIALESNGAGAPDEPDADDLPSDATATTPGTGPPMMMSTLQKRDPDLAKDVRAELADVRKRIDKALDEGKVTGLKARQWHRVLNGSGLQLSVTDAGEIKGPRYDEVLKELAEAEGKAPARRDGVALSTTQAPLPGHLGGGAAGDDDNPVIKFQRELAEKYSAAPK